MTKWTFWDPMYTDYSVGVVYDRYTSKQTGDDTSVYAISLAWPKDNQLTLGAVTATSQTTVTMLGYEAKSFKWDRREAHEGIVVHVPAIQVNEIPCYWAWVFKLDHVNPA